MRRFWDRRARENPWYFINNTLSYRHPDLDRFWTSGEDDLDAILDTLGVSLAHTDHVVEIGCGAGRMTRAIARRAARVTALDIAPAMIGLARAENGSLDNVEWVIGDGASLTGISDGSVDVCISHVVFQHIPEPRVTLGYVREMGRVLRHGGWAGFQVSTSSRAHEGDRPGLRQRFAAFCGLTPKGQADPAWLGSAIDMEDLREAARQGGLAVERVAHEGTQFCIVLARRG